MHYNVLFLCTGNSARSILAEAILNRIGHGKFTARSAGSDPKAKVHPQTLSLLNRLGYPTDGLRCKSWYEFAAAPQMDFVFTVCDSAARDICPVWPGQPMTAHWGVADPSAVSGDDKEVLAAFRYAYTALLHRIELFAALPLKNLDRVALKNRLDAIGSPSDPGRIAVRYCRR